MGVRELETPRVERMQPADLQAVMEVERSAYERGWPETAFERELTHNSMARYLVLKVGAGDEVLAFGGLWLMVDEAHIVTVAVRPEWQRRALGRAVVHGLVELAGDAGMERATLEVRDSNQAARALYREYGFYEVGRRKRYYSDNREDAIIMTTEALASPAYLGRLRKLRAVIDERLPGLTIRSGE